MYTKTFGVWLTCPRDFCNLKFTDIGEDSILVITTSVVSKLVPEINGNVRGYQYVILSIIIKYLLLVWLPLFEEDKQF